MSVTVIPTESGTFLAHRVLFIRSFPDALRNDLFSFLLTACADPDSRVSLEFCFASSSSDRTLSSMLILRADGVQRLEVENRLTRISIILKKKLISAGYTVDFFDDHPRLTESLLALFSGFFSGKLAKYSRSCGFYLPDLPPSSEKKQNYLPASYQDHPLKESVSLSGMLTVLTSYPGSFLSFQLQSARMTSSETGMLASLLASTTDSGAQKHYTSLLELADRCLFEVSVLISGSPLYLKEFTLLMRTSGFGDFDLPRKAMASSIGEHLVHGHLKADRIFRSFGHHPSLRGRLDEPLSRLSLLASPESILSCFAFSADHAPDALPRRADPLEDPSIMPSPLQDSKAVVLGTRMDGDRELFSFPFKALLRHGVLTGKSGSGKTVMAMGILYQLAHAPSPVPFLVIEPTKTEYRTLLQAIPDLRVYTPGKQEHAVPLSLNPFVPPKGITTAAYIPCLKDIFSMSISMDAFLKNAFAQVISDCYNYYGWQDNSTCDSPGVTHFGMHEFIREFRRYTRENIKDPESRNNVENSGVIRLLNLINTDSVMFDTIERPDYEELLAHPTLIELNAISSQEEKALVFAILMKNLDLVIHQRTEHSAGLRNVIMIDEAHVLIHQESRVRTAGEADPGSICVSMLENMILTYRSLGVGILLGDQSPKTLLPLFGQVDLRLIMRIDSGEDLRTISDTVSFSREICDRIPFLNTGYAYAHMTGIEKPVCILGTNWEQQLHLPKEVSDSTLCQHMNPRVGAPYLQCSDCPFCLSGCSLSRRADADAIAEHLMRHDPLHSLLQAEDNVKAQMEIPLTRFLALDLDKHLQEAMHQRRLPGSPSPALKRCTEIHLIRKLLLSGECPIPEERLWRMLPPCLPPSSSDSSDQKETL